MDLVQILLIITLLSQAIGDIWIIILAFQEDWVDGLLCIFLPFAYYFAYKHYNDKKLSTRIPAQLIILSLILPIIMLILSDMPNYFH